MDKKFFWVTVLDCFERLEINCVHEVFTVTNQMIYILWIYVSNIFRKIIFSLLMFFQAARGAQESKVSSHSISAKFSFLDVHDLVFLVPTWYPLYSRNATLLPVSCKSKPDCANSFRAVPDTSMWLLMSGKIGLIPLGRGQSGF